jgi:hypothetical protein
MKYFVSEDVLGEFYKAIADGDPSRLKRVHIPRSDVFYVREAIYNDTGVWYSLDRVERAMYLEGHLKREDVFEPDTPRDWEDVHTGKQE